MIPHYEFVKRQMGQQSEIILRLYSKLSYQNDACVRLILDWKEIETELIL